MESKFTGGVLGYLGISILAGLISVFTFGLGVPWAICMQRNWVVSHTIIDGKQLYFDGTGGQLFGNYILWFFLTIITFGIYGLWLAVNMQRWVAKHTHNMQ